MKNSHIPKITEYRKNGIWYKVKDGETIPDTVEAVVTSQYMTLAEFEKQYPGRKLKALPLKK